MPFSNFSSCPLSLPFLSCVFVVVAEMWFSTLRAIRIFCQLCAVPPFSFSSFVHSPTAQRPARKAEMTYVSEQSSPISFSYMLVFVCSRIVERFAEARLEQFGGERERGQFQRVHSNTATVRLFFLKKYTVQCQSVPFHTPPPRMAMTVEKMNKNFFF